MKAILVEELGGPDKLVYRDHEIGEPGPGQVKISVKYAGVNFPDILIIRGKYQFQPDLPFSPGGEVAGVIKAVGSDVTEFNPGDRVVSGTSWGGFAEEALGFAANTQKLPDTVSFKDAAAVLMTHGTVIHALKDRAKLQKGETLAILGASGGVGSAAIQLGKIIGAKVIACASTDEKLSFCKELGADEVFKYNPGNIKQGLKDLTDGRGVDVIFDAVGGDYTEQAFRAIAPMGRFLVVGFASGYVPKIPMNLPLLKSASLTGVFWGNFFRNYPEENKVNIQRLLEMLSSHKLRPMIDSEIPLSKSAEALKKIENRQVLGKIILKT
ncbi:NADPH2:quinone reductase [Ekhidna lutea]|uniref:NADPH2:quinone reductase n=1 Tax=Ekhidna lutea TaxID=447679 RepID=A0A239JYG2_EKHLU|nr:NADPH:quinone oxidoreductase family protein [Ekhidna lutea]SNT10512.1 NADPH2:quinone reductase [Ekhidna lutea]